MDLSASNLITTQGKNKSIDIQGLISGLILLVGCLFAYVAYENSAHVGWTFDDRPVLQTLSVVEDWHSAIEYLWSANNVSPLGRPISLASFLLNKFDWPNHVSGFRNTNVLIHILNALLLALVLLRISNIIKPLSDVGSWFSVSLALVWVLHPLFASSSFHVIQRMVLLSATFSLLGVLIYLIGRSYCQENPKKCIVLMSVGLMIAGGVGVFVKENAALTPLLVGVLEWTLLSYYAPVRHRHIFLWKVIFFIIPAVLLAIFFVLYTLINSELAYQARPYGMIERLLSESIIMFEYLIQIFIPNIHSMGPFQDDMSRVHGLDITTFVASVLWVYLLYTAVRYRKTSPVYSFAVMFFVVGHLLESTILPLELYFEHRNYLPSLGPLGAFVGLCWGAKKKIMGYMTIGYAVILAALLWQLNVLWGRPLDSAIITVKYHPTSTRAYENLARVYQLNGDYNNAIKTIIIGLRKIPYSSGLGSYLMVYQCGNNRNEEVANEVMRIIDNSQKIYFSRKTATDVHKIINLWYADNCPGVSPEMLMMYIKGLLENPAYMDPDQRYVFYWALGRTYDYAGNQEMSLNSKIKAIEIKPKLEDIVGIYEELMENGRRKEALDMLGELQGKLIGKEYVPESLIPDLQKLHFAATTGKGVL